MISYNTLPFVFLLFSSPLLGQGLSTPNGSVSANGTTDQVIVTGQTKLQNPNGRALIIERDNEDSWLMFHDPDNHWYSLGIDHSNSGLFTINSGGTLGAYPSFLMNSSGYIGIGGVNPINELDVNGRGRFRRQGSSTSGFTIGGDALSLKGWGANNPYIEWINSNEVRQGYLGWNTNRLSLILENEHNFTIENGNVGIGLASPIARLHISDGNVLLQNSVSGYPSMYFKDVTGNNSLKLDFNSIIHTGGHLYLRSGESNHLLLNDTGSGNVGIGTSNPTEKLTVDGAIYSKEVRVDLSVPGPDYVFEKDYHLPSLEELTQYIHAYKHLPGVPTAKEMNQEGIELGVMNMILLKKIEELTLYVIKLQSENQKQDDMIRQLMEKN